MTTVPAATMRGDLRRLDGRSRMGLRWKRAVMWRTGCSGPYREAALNWLALGLLLAAWNVSNDDPANPAQSRPESLRGYTYVSVRAASLHTAGRDEPPMS
jgi:hypothetical protein